jgi:hypothetical protein
VTFEEKEGMKEALKNTKGYNPNHIDTAYGMYQMKIKEKEKTLSELGKEYRDLVEMGYSPDEAKKIATDKKTMGVSVRNQEYVLGKVDEAIKTEDPIKKSQVANLYATQFPDSKNIDKIFRSTAPTLMQLEEAQKLVQTGGAGVADEVKNIFAQYTGMAWDDTTQQGRTAFLSVLHPLAKANITGTVSDRDMRMLQDSFSTLWKSDKAVANAMRNKSQQLYSNLETYYNAHPQYAELRGYNKTMDLVKTLGQSDATAPKKGSVIFDSGKKEQNTTTPPQQESNTTIKPVGKAVQNGITYYRMSDGSVRVAQ